MASGDNFWTTMKGQQLFRLFFYFNCPSGSHFNFLPRVPSGLQPPLLTVRRRERKCLCKQRINMRKWDYKYSWWRWTRGFIQKMSVKLEWFDVFAFWCNMRQGICSKLSFGSVPILYTEKSANLLCNFHPPSYNALVSLILHHTEKRRGLWKRKQCGKNLFTTNTAASFLGINFLEISSKAKLMVIYKLERISHF